MMSRGEHRDIITVEAEVDFLEPAKLKSLRMRSGVLPTETAKLFAILDIV